MPDKVPAPIKLAILKREREVNEKNKRVIIITDCNKYYKGEKRGAVMENSKGYLGQSTHLRRGRFS